MKLVIKNTNAESFGAPINPYNGNHDIEENEKRKDFAQAYPSLLILKDNQPVGEGWSGDVTGVHWQMRMNRDLVEAGIDKELKWKTINVYDGMDLNEPFYRPVYLVAEPVEKQDICIVCDESTTHKSFCADCGLNKADERPTPPQSDTIEERAAKAGKEYYAKDKPANTYTFHSGFIAGATSEREIMSREVEAQEWISVDTDVLPPMEEKTLIILENGDIHLGYYNGADRTGDCWFCDCSDYYYPTHWRYRPKPPMPLNPTN